MNWESFKIVGPMERDLPNNKNLTWVLFGLRSDGAVFWNIFAVEPQHLLGRSLKEAFWIRFQQVMDKFEFYFLHLQMPKCSFVDFSEVGVEEGPVRAGERKFKLEIVPDWINQVTLENADMEAFAHSIFNTRSVGGFLVKEDF